MNVSPVFIRHVLCVAVSTCLVACNNGSPPDTDSAALVAPVKSELDSSMTTANLPAVAREPAVPQLADSTAIASTQAPLQQGQTVRLATRQVLAEQVQSIRPAGKYAGAVSTETYANLADNSLYSASVHPLSTFSIDVDTGAYSNVRRFLNQGQLPPADAVRAEELINYFSYDYPRNNDNAPFSLVTEVAPSPWNAGKQLLHVGIQAQQPGADIEQPPSNLVFLVDVSGSMQSQDKLDLLVHSLKLLSRQLDSEDTISIVVYAGASGVALEPTTGNDTRKIMAALDQLQAGGSTNGAAGIELAYQLAQAHFIPEGINRVLLATDGDFNVGITDFAALLELIESKRKSGISLTTLGFGSGNYNDQLMEQLADAGNGNYAYIDTLNEARKVLVNELDATLQTVAKDVKIQVEFNPAVVSEYRLVGYENRVLAAQDFNNDKVDAGEIGAGHSVTALYELTLVGSEHASIDPLRYQSQTPVRPQTQLAQELAFLKVRYKTPAGQTSMLLEQPVLQTSILPALTDTSDDYRFAAAVAGFSQLLRHNSALGEFNYQSVLDLAVQARGPDPFGYRSEFLNLVRTAQALSLH